MRAGDIGQLFPDTDPAYEGADSMVLLSHVMQLVRNGVAIDERNAIVARSGNHVAVGRVLNAVAAIGLVG